MQQTIASVKAGAIAKEARKKRGAAAVARAAPDSDGEGVCEGELEETPLVKDNSSNPRGPKKRGSKSSGSKQEEGQRGG